MNRRALNAAAATALATLQVRGRDRDGGSNRHSLGPDSRRGPHAHDDSERGAGEDADREPHAARPDADPVVIGLRYETTPEQLRYVLVKLREMLLGHPRVDADPARVRFTGFGDSSLNLEVFAYVMTSEWAEFLGIREDILLRVMEIVEQGGASIAFPSQTLYLGRDHGPDESKVRAAEASVREWNAVGTLPFPSFSPEQARQIRGSIVYPRPRTTAAAAAGREPDTGSAGNPHCAEGAGADRDSKPR